MKFYKYFIVLCIISMLFACPNDGDNVGKSTNDKITSLQAVINDAKVGSTVDLKNYNNITDYNATINKAITIKGADKNFGNSNLTINANGVSLSGVKNSNVTATASLGNGSLKIASSSLSSLTISGGGINSIHVSDCSIDTVTVNKDMSTKDAEYVRLEVDEGDKIGKLDVKSSFFLDGTSGQNIKLNSLSETASIAMGANINVDTSNYLNVKCFNDDDGNNVTVNMVGKKGTVFDKELFNSVMDRNYPDFSYVKDKFLKSIENMEKSGDFQTMTNYKIFLYMKEVDVRIVIEDLPEYVGAIYFWGNFSKNQGEWWTYIQDASDDYKNRYLKEVENGKCEVVFENVLIASHYDPIHYDDSGRPLGGQDLGLQFYFTLMEKETSYSEKPGNWTPSYFTPEISADRAASITSFKDGSKPYCEYVVFHEWCAVGGERKFTKFEGESEFRWDTYPGAFHVPFEKILKDEQYINHQKYVTITINKETYPQLYYSDFPTCQTEAVPCFPNKVIYETPRLFGAESYDDFISGDSSKISSGYQIEFSATPFGD